MNVVAYTALLYGKDYLGYAIRSVIDHVDQYHVIYDASGHGSHGHYTNVPCPDTRDDLYAIASAAAGDKLRWHDAGPFVHEGYQRDSIHQYAPDADVILVLDADEIWADGVAESVIQTFRYHGTSQRRIRLPIIHYWRSFYRCVLHDPAFPGRVIYPKASSFAGIDTWSHLKPINHMGYAQNSEIVRFKLLTHGHRGEFRRDVDWFNDVFMANRQTDCHVVGSEFWWPETVDPLKYMPEWMSQHPYFNLDLIP